MSRPRYGVREQGLKDLVSAVGTADHARLPERAPVTIVEYGDFECPNCKQAVAAINILLRRFSNQVQFVYRHFPLDVHPHALMAAEAAECAGKQGKFWEMHDLLFANQMRLDRKHLLEYAGQLSLDTERFAKELDTQVYRQRVQDDMDSGARGGVRSTPGFFIDGAIEDISFGLHSLLDATEAVVRARPLSYRTSDAVGVPR